METLDWTFWLTEWNWAPSLWIGILLLTGLYLCAAGPLRRRFANSLPVRPIQITWFLLGVLVIFLALESPLDAAGDEYLFSAHMVQHILLTLVMPPLLLAGTPGWMIRPVLKFPVLKAAARFLTNPIPAFLLYNLIFAFWHFPAFYQAALDNETVHLAEHLSFMVSAVIFWWPIMSPVPSELPRLAPPLQLAYLFLGSIPCTILGAIIIFAPDILYPTYANAARLTMLDPLADQQLAGVLMAMLGMAILLGAMGVVFYRWYQQELKHKAVV